MLSGTEAGDCNIANVNWSTLAEIEGNEVDLNIYGENCTGKQLNITIYNNETNNEEYSINTIFNSNTQKQTWTTPDVTTQEKYYFIASNPESEDRTSKILTVIDSAQPYWADMNNNAIGNAQKND